MSQLDANRLAFMRGVLAAFASNGQVVHYDEVRRLCRLNQEQMGTYLGEARMPAIDAGDPDPCAIVVNNTGTPGALWGNPAEWHEALRRAHQFWADRRRLDNADFQSRHTRLPSMP